MNLQHFFAWNLNHLQVVSHLVLKPKANIVYLHDLFDSTPMDQHSIATFNLNQLGVYLITLPGFFNTSLQPLKQMINLQQYANLIAAYLLQQNLKEIILLGQGLGATIAALTYQNLVGFLKKIVLINPVSSKLYLQVTVQLDAITVADQQRLFQRLLFRLPTYSHFYNQIFAEITNLAVLKKVDESLLNLPYHSRIVLTPSWNSKPETMAGHWENHFINTKISCFEQLEVNQLVQEVNQLLLL